MVRKWMELIWLIVVVTVLVLSWTGTIGEESFRRNSAVQSDQETGAVVRVEAGH